MPAIAVHRDDDATRGRAGHRPFPRRVAAIVLIALALGVAVGRFTTMPDPSPARATAAASPATAVERVAQFEQATLENPEDARAWQQLAIASVQAVAEGRRATGTEAGGLEGCLGGPDWRPPWRSLSRSA